jgi:hypothetical protein
MYVYVYMYMCVYIYIYIYIYTSRGDPERCGCVLKSRSSRTFDRLPEVALPC